MTKMSTHSVEALYGAVVVAVTQLLVNKMAVVQNIIGYQRLLK